MTQEIKISPPNSLILLMDKDKGEIPEAMGGQLVAVTRSCVAVGTLAEFDGSTTVKLDTSADAQVSGSMVFDGEIATPSRELSICSVLLEPYLSTRVPSTSTRVRVYVNDDSEPDEIWVLVG